MILRELRIEGFGIWREQRLDAAHDVLVNDRDLGWLKREVERLHDFYINLRGGQP